MAAWQYSASNFGLLLFLVLFAQLSANGSTSNRNSTHSIHTFHTKCLRISWFGSMIREGDILWKINQEINMCYRRSFSYPLFEGQWGLDQWLPRQAKGTQPPSSEEMLISGFTLKICVFVYFWAGKLTWLYLSRSVRLLRMSVLNMMCSPELTPSITGTCTKTKLKY